MSASLKLLVIPTALLDLPGLYSKNLAPSSVCEKKTNKIFMYLENVLIVTYGRCSINQHKPSHSNCTSTFTVVVYTFNLDDLASGSVDRFYDYYC